MKHLLFAGGDQRILSAVEYLQQKGISVQHYAVTARIPIDGSGAEALILPYPCLKNGRLNCPLLSQPPTVEEMLEETGVSTEIPAIGGPLKENPFPRYTDLGTREDWKARNGLTTAQGALGMLIPALKRSLLSLPVLVTGYGAIAAPLARSLQHLGAQVTVAARRQSQRVTAELEGFEAVDTVNLDLTPYAAILNTVPALLFPEGVLQSARPGTVLLELASHPGGFDRPAAARLGLPLLDGPGLPGKFCPVTAGEDLAKTILDILKHT